MGGPRDARGLDAARDWPGGIRSGSITPRSVAEAVAIAFTAADDEALGIHKRMTRAVAVPGTATVRELYIAGGKRIGLGRDTFSAIYHGARWLTMAELEKALNDPLLGPPMLQRLLPNGSCDISKALLAYASSPGHSGPVRSRVRQSGLDPSDPPMGNARSRKVHRANADDISRQRPSGVRDAVRRVLRDGRPRRSAAVKAAVRESYYGGVLTDRNELAVSSALSHLAINGEIEKQADGRYRATTHLEANQKP